MKLTKTRYLSHSWTSLIHNLMKSETDKSEIMNIHILVNELCKKFNGCKCYTEIIVVIYGNLNMLMNKQYDKLFIFCKIYIYKSYKRVQNTLHWVPFSTSSVTTSRFLSINTIDSNVKNFVYYEHSPTTRDRAYFDKKWLFFSQLEFFI